MGYKEIRYRTFDGSAWTEHQCTAAIPQTGAENIYSTQVDLLVNGDDIYFLIVDYSGSKVYIYDPVLKKRKTIYTIPDNYYGTHGLCRCKIQLVEGVVYCSFTGDDGPVILFKNYTNIFDDTAWSIGYGLNGVILNDFLVDTDGNWHCSSNSGVSLAYHDYSSNQGASWTTTNMHTNPNGFNNNYKWILFEVDGIVYGGGVNDTSPYGAVLKSWSAGSWTTLYNFASGYIVNQRFNQVAVDKDGWIVHVIDGWGSYGWDYINWNQQGGGGYTLSETGMPDCGDSLGDFVINSDNKKLYARIPIHESWIDYYKLTTYYDGTQSTTHGALVDGLSVGSVACDFVDSLPYVIFSIYSDSAIPPPPSACSLSVGDLVNLLQNPTNTLIEKSADLSVADRVRVYQGDKKTIIQRSCPDISVGDRVSVTSNGLIRKSK